MQLLRRSSPRHTEHLLFPLRASDSAHSLVSVQPVRIDVPLVSTSSRHPPLTTFRSPAQRSDWTIPETTQAKYVWFQMDSEKREVGVYPKDGCLTLEMDVYPRDGV
uniref:Uncharacterized protein n=1 Tax=Knipowitschia caucasica TaxID=637954 RepID=A0AAV2JKD1_KNICA